MKKILSMLLMSSMVLGSLSACSSTSTTTSDTPAPTTETADKAPTTETADNAVKIVATTFPEYDWLRQIVGEDNELVELTLLLQNGVDLHSYQPTIEDIVTISSADLFVHVGGSSDGWVDDVMAEATNDNLQVLNEVSILGSAVKMEETVEGMEGTHDEHDDHDHAEGDHDHDHEEDDHDHEEDDHDHDHEEDDHDHEEDDHDHEEDDHDHDHEEDDHDHDDHSGHAHEDEHVWMSLNNAMKICTVLTETLVEMMPEQKDTFETNLEAYLGELSQLDEDYAAMVAETEGNTILVADRFPFRYLTDDYGIEYYAAFSGCSAETEASFETIAFLSEKVDELGLTIVLTEKNVTHTIAETVISSSAAQDQTIMALDAMQGTTLSEANSGVSYLNIMTSNLEVLKEALK